jgi:hypothetical protein
MSDIFRTSRLEEFPLCWVPGELRERYRAGNWCGSISIYYCSIPCSYMVSRPNVGGDTCLCDHVQHDHKECQEDSSQTCGSLWVGGPLAGVDHQVPAYFANFIAMHEDPWFKCSHPTTKWSCRAFSRLKGESSSVPVESHQPSRWLDRVKLQFIWFIVCSISIHKEYYKTYLFVCLNWLYVQCSYSWIAKKGAAFGGRDWKQTRPKSNNTKRHTHLSNPVFLPDAV